jgi:uncharacterized protein (TIGR00255 family)
MVSIVYSMTGFAAATQDLSYGTLALELKTVNHRYLEISFRMPDALRMLEPLLRERISARLQRGKVDCRIEWRQPETVSAAVAPLDISALERLRESSAIIQEVFPDATPLSVGDILRWPGVFNTQSTPEQSIDADCAVLAETVVGQLNDARAREGAKLKEFLLERVDALQQLANTVAPQIPALVAAFQERLASRMRDALGSDDEDRVRQEVVLFAAKTDVEEELSRLKVHLDEVRRILNGGGAVGKRLDFLMQELNREANTLGSKSVASNVSRASMDMKGLIEQMREQIQNLE